MRRKDAGLTPSMIEIGRLLLAPLLNKVPVHISKKIYLEMAWGVTHRTIKYYEVIKKYKVKGHYCQGNVLIQGWRLPTLMPGDKILLRHEDRSDGWTDIEQLDNNKEELVFRIGRGDYMKLLKCCREIINYRDREIGGGRRNF